MPLYEYECKNGHRFETFRPMAESGEPIHCSECRAVARQLVSVPAPAQFGWRLTDAAHERFGPREEVEKDV